MRRLIATALLGTTAALPALLGHAWAQDGSPDDGDVQRGGTLVVQMSSEQRILNPALRASTGVYNITGKIVEPLAFLLRLGMVGMAGGGFFHGIGKAAAPVLFKIPGRRADMGEKPLDLVLGGEDLAVEYPRVPMQQDVTDVEDDVHEEACSRKG